MFGQQNNSNQNDQIPDQSIDGAMQDDSHHAAITPVSSNGQDWQHPGQPLDAPASDAPQPTAPAVADDNVQDQPADEPPLVTQAPAPHVQNELIDIKQAALTQLSPLVGHLEQTPEEKFRTTMMMIQASDDQSLIQTAYDAAQAITDEKAKAQALLDIVNEINYFTQQHHQ
jgi:hypothetical protein